MRENLRMPLMVIALLIGTTHAFASDPQPAVKPSVPAQSGPIHQEVVYDASPQRIYEALLDSTQFSALTHMPAEIHREVGDSFRCFGGIIEGRNIELVPNQRIVQAWRANHWPAGVYSIVRFELKPEGTGTRVVLDHTGFELGEEREPLDSGWSIRYWEPLRKYLRGPGR